MALRIEDYGLIGDCQTAALVGRDGSMDWLCLPRFDSGACFAALLGAESNGRWLIAPSDRVRRITRRYRPETLILETLFSTSQGTVRITDFMPIRTSTPDVIRIVEGVHGKVHMRMELVIRFDYGSITPWLLEEEGVHSAIAGPDRLTLRTRARIEREDTQLGSDFTVRAGERVAFTLTWSPSNEKIPSRIDPASALRATERWWKEWVRACTAPRPWRDKLVRSLITLKALTYGPTGGIVAAATTSLPERICGVRNWDYRFCWLRDASFTLFALMGCGYVDEARAWLRWLLRATAGHPAQLQVMYGVAGERRLTELEVEWLAGYECSKPVRIGNAATEQFQLDIFGELLDAIHKWWTIQGRISDFGWSIVLAMVEFLETAWKRPDEGIWEVRGPQRHFTHSKLMAWVAFDRAIDIAENSSRRCPLKRWKAIREQIRQEILERGFNPKLNAFVQFYGANRLDASVLRMPLVGFISARDERFLGTVSAMESDLIENGFMHRYRNSRKVDGLPEGEGAFLMCTLWYADVLHMMGRKKDSRKVFERVLSVANDLGLLSEMYDPKTKRQVGNFPQAFSHVGLVNTALRLSGASGVPDKPRQKAIPGKSGVRKKL